MAIAILIAGITSGSLAVVVLFSVCFVKCSRRRNQQPLLQKTTYNSSEEDSPRAFPSYNTVISQSTPDITRELKSSSDVIEEEEQIGKNTFRTVIKQLTLPIVSQRHFDFNRQLSDQFDHRQHGVEFAIHNIKYKEQPIIEKIKPELYRQNAQEALGRLSRESSVQPPEGSLETCGKLTFSLCYHTNAETLTVHILKADNLPAKDFSGTSDPYVKLYLLPDRKNKHQTKVHRKTLNPIFDERFNFRVPYKDLVTRTLQFSIYDFDRFSRHDLIGIILLRDFTKSKDLTWEQTYEMDILAAQQEPVDLGELLISLCYLPTAGRLTVTIIKARNLKAMDITGTSDPYVKVSLMCHGRRVKKKKTSVKKNDLNPVYNEAIVFDVPQENIEEVSLIIKVVDYDRVGSNELMGCCGVGLNHMDTGRDHWLEMLENSRKPVAQWYTLQEHIPCSASSAHANGGSNLSKRELNRIRNARKT